MTIKEIIEKLKKYDENIKVCISYDSDCVGSSIKKLVLETELIDGKQIPIVYLSEDEIKKDK